MSRTRNIAAQGIVDRLHALERAIDAAIASGGELAMFMPQARMQAHVAAEVGHEALAHATGALSTLVQARGQVVAAHRELSQVKDQLGLRELAVGGAGDKPGDNPVKANLSLVRHQSA
jgi:hypothetical protein